MVKFLKNILVSVMMLVLSFVMFNHSALAFVAFNGQLTATDTCKALSSIKNNTNPGNLKLKVGELYPIAGKNKPDATHYLLEISDASPSQRWVATNCGTTDSLVPGVTDNPDVNNDNDLKSREYILAISWQPAFCETHQSKPECKTLENAPTRFEATNFALHGLFPQPNGNFYCGVSASNVNLDKAKKWSLLPAIENNLQPATWTKLQEIMPGTASDLHRHEWIKHGTCYPGNAEAYFAESIALLENFNASSVQDLAANNINNAVTIREIDTALAKDFGSNAGKKVEVKCENSLLVELYVSLQGDITPKSTIAKLIADSPNTKSEGFSSCVIDDVTVK